MSSIKDFPALRPPPGVKSNFVDPPSLVPSAIVVESIFLPLMILAVLTRIFVRAKITKGWGWDDYTCILAACGSIVHMINHARMLRVGLGRHLWDIRAITLMNRKHLQTLFANGCVFPITIFFAKASILFLYLRVFYLDRIIRGGAWGGLIFQGLFYSAAVTLDIVSLVQCSDPVVRTKNFCRRYGNEIQILILVFNILTDIYIIILPIRRISNLQLSFRRKIGLFTVFAGGLFTSAIGIARLIYFTQHYNSPDIMWVIAINVQLSVAELNSAIIVACMSTFPAFFARIASVTSNLYSPVRKRLRSWWSTVVHSVYSHSQNSSVKKYGEAGESWAELIDAKPGVPRGGSEVAEIESQAGTDSQNRILVDTDESELEQPGILRTVDFSVAFSCNGNR